MSSELLYITLVTGKYGRNTLLSAELLAMNGRYMRCGAPLTWMVRFACT